MSLITETSFRVISSIIVVLLDNYTLLKCYISAYMNGASDAYKSLAEEDIIYYLLTDF